MSNIYIDDIDPIETQEWLDSLESVFIKDGHDRVNFLLKKLINMARSYGIDCKGITNTPYKNTIPYHMEKTIYLDQEMENKISSLIRWNAIIMVLRAERYSKELGGHIASYASAATLYDVGFNHFFKGSSENDETCGDLLYIQGHCSPGIYARAFLEGRLSEKQLSKFRQEIDGDGLSSYPHPWLMPNFWQFPTVSMGLGAIQAIYQARFLKYLENRNLANTTGRKVWAFLGDGEMDEPESLGAISIASREKLDNLIFVINCNLQRLDGPVRGNGKIIQELESIFFGAGWNVIKVIWGKSWDPLFDRDKYGYLQNRMEECLDGDYQTYKTKNGAYIREHFFGKNDVLKNMVSDMSDDEIFNLNWGGHDFQKVYSAYHSAISHKGSPIVILAKTVKGYGMGMELEGNNITHQQKNMSVEQLKKFKNRFNIPIHDETLDTLPFYKPNEQSPEIIYLKKKRKDLGGYLPIRYTNCEKFNTVPLSDFYSIIKNSQIREMSTTMIFVKILTVLLQNKNLGPRIVPIVPDECRTFGMEGLFRKIGIYSPCGQLYTPSDKEQIMYYKETKNGQILEEGINESGAFCSWIAASTSYSSNKFTMIPFYIFYSMFGFQRIGDLAWAAGDMRSRGFLLGGTAGRTTLSGEGLQHQDGHSHIFASVIPNCISYDPAYSYELAVIIQHGLYRMYEKHENVFFYITITNERYIHPNISKESIDGIVKGMYLLKKCEQEIYRKKNNNYHVQLLGSGSILQEVISASKLLIKDYKITSDIWSVTSFNELRKNGICIERYNRLHPKRKPKINYINSQLEGYIGPVIAVTDYVRLYADQIRPFVSRPFISLGTDGYGRSDTRKNLRHFFEINAKFIVIATIDILVQNKILPKLMLIDAIHKYGISDNKINPMKS